MVTLEEMEDDIAAAEAAVAADSDRLPIVHPQPDGTEHTHGYVAPGEHPVAFTRPLQAQLNDIVAEDGAITGLGLPDEYSPGTYTRETRYPDDDGYIQLLNDQLTSFRVRMESPADDE